MWIETARITNYKSFRDSGEIPFQRGVTVIIGANDVGKSAMLEALSLRVPAVPHRSAAVMPTAFSVVNQSSGVALSMAHDASELHAVLQSHVSFVIPTPSDHKRLPTDPGALSTLLAEGFRLHVTHRLGGSPSSSFVMRACGQATGDAGLWWRFENPLSPAGVSLSLEDKPLSSASGPPEFPVLLGGGIDRRIFHFRAERLALGTSGFNGQRTDLIGDASNLAFVLNRLLSGDPTRARLLLEHIRAVFPRIAEFVAPPDQNNNAVIAIKHTHNAGRTDLTVPLSAGGTGLGQVLAILTVVVTASEPQVILIDEPQSFLHPGAVRTLFAILRDYPQHQYIVTTHAPAMIAATASESILRVEMTGDGASTVHSVSPSDRSAMHAVLRDVGAHMSDVFAADAVLWVEGQTEAACFPLIARALGLSLGGTQILAVSNTDTVTGKTANQIVDIYTALTRGGAILPTTLGFLFDREGRSAGDREDLSKRVDGKLHWLDRRMFENYLLEPTALAEVLTDDDPECPDGPHTADSINAWITSHGAERRFWPDTNGEVPPTFTPEWHRDVHAGKLLSALFSERTGTRVTYQKVRHGRALIEALVAAKYPFLGAFGPVLRRALGLPLPAPPATFS
jgi:AAA domain, putative AbiEii toxin, Type IV TA system/AAA ATPase domain